MRYNLPRYIAICGYPGSGKSTVQELLKDYGVCPVDDGRVLRDACKVIYGLTEEQVTTQEGKKERVGVNRKAVQVRDLLGEMGNYLERAHGPEIVAELAVLQAHRQFGKHLAAGHSVSFGSVRREQGAHYKALGDAMVLGVVRPGVQPSPFEFDVFNPDNVDLWLHNDGDLARLKRYVHEVVQHTSARRSARGYAA